MPAYRCTNCGYSGDRLIFQFNDYTYCVASNEEEPEYLEEAPDWVGGGDAEIEDPVGCSECHVWGVTKFERIDS
jgi:hypothetical protein